MIKNNYFAILIFLLFVSGISTQNLNIDDRKNLLTKKENMALEKAIEYNSDFFNRLFPPKTINSSDINIVFSGSFMEYMYIQSEYVLPKINSSGFFSSKDSTVVILKEKDTKDFLQTCYHELSHAFLHIYTDNDYIPAWFIEGLGTYQEQLTYHKNEITHTANKYYIARVKTLIELQDIDLDEFVKWDYEKFSRESFSQEGYGYAISYCMVLLLMRQSEDVAFSIFRNLRNEYSTSEIFDKYYAGGFSQFEKDFIEYFKTGIIPKKGKSKI